jgi:Ca2+:H+ antiporter
MRTHHSIYNDLLHEEQQKDVDLHRDLAKERLTLVEALIAVAIAVTCVSFLAVFLVLEIHPLVKYYHVHDAFVGLIIVPLVEKAAEHLTAVDEAWDNQINLALAHVLGATIQTALFNAPLVVLVGWGLHKGMDLNFEIFMVVLLVLAILVVGNFLRDGKTNYLEGALCVIIYLIIAISTWYIPNPPH